MMTSQDLPSPVTQCASRLGALNSRSSSVSSRSVAPAAATWPLAGEISGLHWSPAWEKAKGGRNHRPGRTPIETNGHRKFISDSHDISWFSSSSAKDAWRKKPFNMGLCWDGWIWWMIYKPTQVKGSDTCLNLDKADELVAAKWSPQKITSIRNQLHPSSIKYLVQE